MNRLLLAIAAVAAALLPGLANAEQSDRPATLELANFQFGPQNRWAFSHMREVMPSANIPHDGRRVLALKSSDQQATPFELEVLGVTLPWDEIATRQYIDGVLVLKNNRILLEEYYGHLAPERPHLMMSVTKSVVGLLAEKLAREGVVDLNRTVASYVPELAASGWGPDSLRLLLDMQDGADYTEEYEDMNSTVRQQDCAAGWTNADYCPANGPSGGYEFFPTVGRNADNLGTFVYKSGSTDVIGWVLEVATGEPLAELIAKHIWQPMGAEFDASITVDSSGFALGDGGMSATLRDLGRFGLMVLNGGEAFGEAVVPAAVINDIHSQPGDPDWPYSESSSEEEPYYRSFWWGKGNAERDILGLGVHGQYLHVAREAGIVVVIFSSWPRADGTLNEHPDSALVGWNGIYAVGDALVQEFR